MHRTLIGSVQNYTVEGLRTFGELVLKVKNDNDWSWREFARKANIGSGTTVQAWTKNIKGIVQEPTPANLTAIATLILNPLTGKPFTGTELFLVCRGELIIPNDLIERQSFRIADSSSGTAR